MAKKNNPADSEAMKLLSGAMAQPKKDTRDKLATHGTHGTRDIRGAYDTRRAARDTREPKSRRINLHIQPSICDDLAAIAHMKQTSVNDLITVVLREYTVQETELIEKYYQFFS